MIWLSRTDLLRRLSAPPQRAGSAREVLRGALLALGLQGLLRDELLDREVQFLGHGTHARGDLLDALAGVAFHVVQQATGETLDLVRIPLLTFFAATAAHRRAGCRSTSTASTTTRGRATTAECFPHCFHRGVADQS